MKKQLLLFVMMLLPMIASADPVQIDGIWYNLVNKSKTAEVTRDPSKSYGSYSGDIIIPSKVTYGGDDYDVTTIGNGTFYICHGLTSIMIPNSVTRIGGEAFVYCDGLTSINIPNSVTTIGGYAFSNCTGLMSIVFPNSVTNIGNNALYNCSGLTSVTLPNNITSIEFATFQGCTSLSSIDIPSSVTTINSQVFSQCSGLTSIIIPEGVTRIESNTFNGCSSLTSMYVPNQISFIGENAFRNCSNLATVMIGTGVQSIGSKCFAYCGELAHVYCLAENVPTTASDAFENSDISLATLHVPSASLAAYSTADVWQDFGSKVADNGVFYQMTVNASGNGTVTYSGQQIKKTSKLYDVKEGSNVQLTITPDTGYEITSLTVNGTDATGDLVADVLTISNVTANTTVAVTFSPISTTLAVTLTADMGTLYAADDLDFTNVAGLSAYIGSGFNATTGVLTMTRVYDVPAGTGLVLVGAAGNYDIPYADSPSVYANLLKGASENITIWQYDGGCTNYVLANGSQGLGFYQVDNYGQLAAGKAYLSIPSSQTNNAPAFMLDFMEGITGINEIEQQKQNAGLWYDLQGRRIIQPTKAGIYLNNGRKVIVK